MDLGLKGKVALITGGSLGIGFGSAQSMAREGADVALCARGEEQLKRAVEKLKPLGTEVMAIVGDATEKADVKRMVDEVVSRFGRLDILVSNVGGVFKRGHFMDLTDEEWEASLKLNFYSAFKASRAALPHMLKNGWGRIIFISTVVGRELGGPPLFHEAIEYSFSKNILLALNKIISKGVARDNVTVNCVCPGPIRTEGAWGSRPKEVVDTILQDVPMSRLGEKEEVGDLVAFLASERAAYITGSVINIDGGFANCLS
jgi:3-oxoacyl-[acyl-carrier protein] reductase